MSVTSVGALLRHYLLNDQAITTLIGSRIYPVRLPEKVVMPAIVYMRVSGTRFGVLRGAATGAEARYQIDAWASTQAAALALGAAIRHRLDGFTGTWLDAESPTEVSAFVQARFDIEQDLFEEEILGGLCRHSADYLITHSTTGGLL